MRIFKLGPNTAAAISFFGDVYVNAAGGGLIHRLWGIGASVVNVSSLFILKRPPYVKMAAGSERSPHN